MIVLLDVEKTLSRQEQSHLSEIREMEQTGAGSPDAGTA
jgi:hypothetical protein